MADRIAILDYGSQYTQLIARRIRELGVYLPKGVILSGGPNSVFEEGAPGIDADIFSLGVPVLGVCYGMQLMSRALGGRVEPGVTREYGKTEIESVPGSALFADVPSPLTVWMSHGDRVEEIPPGFSRCASSATCANAAMADDARRFYGLQFRSLPLRARLEPQELGGVDD